MATSNGAARVRVAQHLGQCVALAALAIFRTKGACGPLERGRRRVDERECIDAALEWRVRNLSQHAPIVQLVGAYEEQRLAVREGGTGGENGVGEIPPPYQRLAGFATANTARCRKDKIEAYREALCLHCFGDLRAKLTEHEHSTL